jgi:hypothetical protein
MVALSRGADALDASQGVKLAEGQPLASYVRGGQPLVSNIRGVGIGHGLMFDWTGLHQSLCGMGYCRDGPAW